MDIKKIFTGRWQVAVLAITACFLWGSAFPSLKISYAEIMPFNVNAYDRMIFASLRFFIASLMLFSIILINGQRKELFKIKKYFLLLLILGAMQTSLQYFFFYNGLANTTGVKSSIISTSGIFMTVIASHFVYKNDKLDFKKSIGIILGFLGVLFVNLNRGELNAAFLFAGEGFLIISAAISAAASFLAKKLTGSLNALIVTAWQMFMGSLLLFTAASTGSNFNRLSFSPISVVLLFYLAFISAAAFALWYTLIKYNALGFVTIYKFMIPVSGVFLSSILLPGERINLIIVASMLLVSLGIIIINYRPGLLKNKYI
ncbi:DMT family transporter [Halanaerobium congolense]|uniref:DMT family transporter n=1 Tax=Halanaerobium congolense TaxID=54121 RepID=UPI00105F998F|nr:DMT family transporter [Halanaerobium congolense]TDP07719.1 EamA-like transporter family protein [Halanaerobium congolense]